MMSVGSNLNIFYVDEHKKLNPSLVRMSPPESDNPRPCGRHKWMAPNVASANESRIWLHSV